MVNLSMITTSTDKDPIPVVIGVVTTEIGELISDEFTTDNDQTKPIGPKLRIQPVAEKRDAIAAATWINQQLAELSKEINK